MPDLGDALAAARKRVGLSQAALGEQLNVHRATINRRERGNCEMSTGELARLVECTGQGIAITPSGWQIADQHDAPAVTLRSFGRAPCGEPIYVETDEPEEVDLGHLTDGVWDVERHYLLRAAGDSMEPWIYDGDWMIVEHERLPRISDIVVANINGQGCTVKRLAPSRDGGGRVLAPTNPAHRPIELTEYDEVECQGVVVGCIRAYVSLADGDPIATRQRTQRRRLR